ncbi:MAG TPA: DUF2844 domain-containing protein [Candidatus Aquilonibacter sp.]|nr:DUF2844 domain-containing protein [Candidatus Aquilonibacter sp.]
MSPRRPLCGHLGRLKPALWISILSAIALFPAPPAFAALGQSVSSVQADQLHMHATLRTTKAEAYEVQEIDAPTGTIVREYVSSGKVFAIAWHGPWPPDMRQILGSYFDAYVTATQAQASSHAGRKPLRIEQPGLVVEAGGHMRWFVGKAYIPDMLPQGVSAEEIR